MQTAMISTTGLINPFDVIERSAKAATTKYQYAKALRNYLATGNSLTDVDALVSYSLGLKTSSRAFLKAAIKMWCKALELHFKGNATPENVATITASLYRLDATTAAIETTAPTGTKMGLWLTLQEVKQLDDVYKGDDTKSKRNRLIIGLSVGAGLRRDELVNLKFSDVKKQGDRAFLAVTGKGSKNRTIPISERLAVAVFEMKELVSGADDSLIIRSINGHIGDSISAVAVFNIIRQAGAKIGHPELAPHDCRRTFAHLGYEAGIPITQISTLLGHSSIATTQKYLNLETDMETTISDFIPVFN